MINKSTSFGIIPGHKTCTMSTAGIPISAIIGPHTGQNISIIITSHYPSPRSHPYFSSFSPMPFKHALCAPPPTKYTALLLMIQDDDLRQSDVRSASALSDHATTLKLLFQKSPKRNIAKPASCMGSVGVGTEPTVYTATPTSSIGKAMSESIGFIKGNPKSNNFFHLL